MICHLYDDGDNTACVCCAYRIQYDGMALHRLLPSTTAWRYVILLFASLCRSFVTTEQGACLYLMSPDEESARTRGCACCMSTGIKQNGTMWRTHACMTDKYYHHLGQCQTRRFGTGHGGTAIYQAVSGQVCCVIRDANDWLVIQLLTATFRKKWMVPLVCMI